MPKTKWEGAEDPTTNNFFKIENRNLNKPFHMNLEFTASKPDLPI